MRTAILLLKANPHHDRLGRFARAPAHEGSGGQAPVRVVDVDHTLITGTDRQQLRAAARTYAQTHFTGGMDAAGRTLPLTVHNARGFGAILLSPAGVTHALSTGSRPALPQERDAHHFQIVAGLPDLLREAAHVQTVPDRHGRHSIKAIHDLRAAARMDGCLYRVAIVVREHEDGSRFYDHDLSDIRYVGMLAPDDPPSSPKGEGHRHQQAGGSPGAFVDIALLKSLFNDGPLAKALPAGARWITVRPNGPGTEGTPVMIQPSPDGAYRVVGGAGGKLNYLKLTGVRSEKEYAARAKESAAARKQQKKQRAVRDREAGIVGTKEKAIAQLRLTAQAARDSFVQAVAKVLDWKPEDMKFRREDHQDRPPGEVDQAEAEHFDKLYQAAEAAAKAQRDRLLADADMRSEANIPLTAPPDDPGAISVADLDPVTGTEERGLGFRPRYDGRAGEAGAKPEDIKAEADEIQPPRAKPEPAAEQAALPGTEAPPADKPADDKPAAKPDLAAETGKALETVREPIGPRINPKARATARQAMDVLRAEREMRAKLKEVRTRAKDISKADSKDEVEATAFVIEVGGKAVDDDVRQGIEDELRTIRTRGFLNEAEKEGAHAIPKHVGIGAYNAINSVALAAGGAGLMDRSVVDVLGPAAAAQALAHRLAADLPDADMAAIKEAMGRYHVEHYMARSTDALAEARDLQEQAAEIQLGEVASADDLALAQELNARRRELSRRAKAILAQTLGEMETNAALVTALDKPTRDRITVPMGDMKATDAIVRLRALGLERGDYTLERAGRNTILVIAKEAIGKLTSPIARDDIERVNGSLRIMQGLEDEDGWLPKGVANRPDFGREAPAGVAPRLARPFPSAPGDVGQAVRDYIGGRMADGDAPADIMAGLLAEDVIQRAGDRDAFMAAVNEVAPLYDSAGKMIRAEAHADGFEKLADAFTEREYGTTRAPIHRQTVEQDRVTVEALHRALAGTPEAMLAFQPVGDLSPEDQGALRKVFEADLASRDPAAAAKREAVAKMDAEEPEREVDDMFGRGTNPEWTRWKAERDTAAAEANAASFTWPRYVEAMGSPQAAYQAIQDIVRGKAMRAFAEAHNKLRPNAPLRIGRAGIRGDLAHLDAVDPKARAARAEAQREMTDRLRNRVAGRYAQGSVADKMAAAREADEAAQQSQMGLFGDEPAAPTEAGTLPENDAPLAPGERWTVGHAAERALAGMAARTGRMWKPGQPVNLFAPKMDGRFIARQRAVKLIAQNRRVVLGMGVGSGKAQPLHSLILTPSGWKAMGAVQPGDEVIAGDGSVCRVTGVFPQGEKRIYRVIMNDGAQAECCDEHLWLTQTQKERDHGRRPRVRPLLEIMKDLEVAKMVGSRRHTIPLVGPVALPARPVPLDPYLIGLLVGDGGFTSPGTVIFTTRDAELVDAVKACLPPGLMLKASGHHGQATSYRFTTGRRGRHAGNFVLEAARQLGLAGCCSATKFIPDCYLFNDAATRAAVLQGLVDTDGTVSADGMTVSYTTVSEALRDGMVFLARSLGGVATVTSKRPAYSYKGERKQGQVAFTIWLRLPPAIAPARLRRKAGRVVPKSKYAPTCRFIERVEFVGMMECRCIAVDHPSRLYVTDDFIVTHNTSIMLSAFTHLKETGKAKRGLFLVPSIVQGQFHGEAHALLEPGRYDWHAKPGADREERIKAMKGESGHDFVVLTHQSFRDDVLHLAAQHAGVDPAVMMDRISEMTPEYRADHMRETLAREGIDFDYLAVDEGHNLLNRKGKQDSRMAQIVDAVAHHTPSYVSASADPVKNDASELFDVLRKMDPKRYANRDAFMRRYGVDTASAKDGLRRELARHFYTSSIASGVNAKRTQADVALHPEDRARADSIQRAAGAARLARMEGRVDIAAIRELSPNSFEGVPPEQHEEVAKRLGDALGVVRDSAMRRALNGRGKQDHVSKLAGERKGRPGVIFCHHLDQVEALAARLTKEGHKVTTMTGKHGAKEKDQIKRGFNSGEHDILIASDAGMVGANLQHGKWLVQFDTPQTAMAHAQRNGRIDRFGQTEDVELFDLVADHPAERTARDRLARKYGLRDIVTSPLDGLDDTGLAGMIHRIRAGKADDAPPQPAATEAERARADQGAREEEPALF